MLEKEPEVKRIKMNVRTETKRIPVVAYLTKQPEAKPRTIKVNVRAETKRIGRPRFDFDE
jgi:hypothetical protein